MTRRKEQLWSLIPLAVVLLLGAGVLFLCQQITPTPAQEVQPQISLEQVNEEDALPEFVVKNGPQQRAQAPLARYPVTPLEGYDHTTDSTLTANRESDSYTDCFLGQGVKVTLTQRPVANQERVTFPVEVTPVQAVLGRLELFCYITDQQSGAYWVYNDRLFQLTVSGRMEPEQMKDWAGQLDYSHPAVPETSPLTFLPSYQKTTAGAGGTAEDSSGWKLGGNPDPDPAHRNFCLSRLPEGFSSPETGLQGQGRYPDQWEYQNAQGDRILLQNLQVTGDTNCSIFSEIPESEYNNSDLVQSVTVNGRQARLYCTSDYAELVVLGADVAGQLIYQGGITPQAMLELGEGLILE